MHRIRGKLTYANVVATMALFLVLAGGTAFAAKQMLPKNSVGTSQIKNNAITGAKLKNGSVTAAKIASGAITGANVDAGSLGTVPNATHAATADQAKAAESARSATSATTAGNAQALQGLSPAQIEAVSKLGCPSDTTLVGGECFENTARPATGYLLALYICAEAGRFIPSVSELSTFDGVTKNPGAAEWAGQLYYDGTELVAATITKASTGSPPIATNHPYRCAEAASN